MRVESGAHDDQVGLECGHLGDHDLVEELEPSGAVGPRRHRDVDRRSRRAGIAAVRRVSRARVPRVLVQRRVQHRRVGIEDVLAAVAVMHVDVDDRHARGTCLLSDANRDRRVVEEAESHWQVGVGVMSGRPDHGERRAGLALHHRIGRACGARCSVAAPRRTTRAVQYVSGSNQPPPLYREALHPPDLVLGMDEQGQVTRRLRCFEPRQSGEGRVRGNAVEDRAALDPAAPG